MRQADCTMNIRTAKWNLNTTNCFTEWLLKEQVLMWLLLRETSINHTGLETHLGLVSK